MPLRTGVTHHTKVCMTGPSIEGLRLTVQKSYNLLACSDARKIMRQQTGFWTCIFLNIFLLLQKIKKYLYLYLIAYIDR